MTNNSCQLSKIKILIAQCQLLDFFSNVDTSGRKLTAQKVTFWTKSKQKYLSMTLTEISFFFWKQQIWLISILFQTNRNFISSLVCKRKYVEQNSYSYMLLFSQLTFLRIHIMYVPNSGLIPFWQQQMHFYVKLCRWQIKIICPIFFSKIFSPQSVMLRDKICSRNAEKGKLLSLMKRKAFYTIPDVKISK